MTLKKIVRKIIHDPKYAREIAELLARARKKDKAAVRELKRRFKPLPRELAELGIKAKGFGPCDETVPTQTRFIDFAAFVK